MNLMLAGTVAPMKPGEEDSVFPGRVWFGADGSVAAVTKEGEQPPLATTADREVDVGDAFIYPGLVDLHSHLGYNTLPLWTDPTRTTPYLHHDIWPGEPSYAPSISWPAWTLLARAPECVLAYVQLRALAGGTTAIQGWPNVSRPPTNVLVRCVDDDQVGPLPDPVMVSALTQDVAQLTQRAQGLESGRVFVYHCAEGQPGSIVTREFDDVNTAGCLQQGLRHPLLRLGRVALRTVETGIGIRHRSGRDGRMVPVLQPVALRHHDRCPGGAFESAARVPRHRLGAVGNEESSRRDQGRAVVERPSGLGTHRSRPGRDGHRFTGRRPGAGVAAAGRELVAGGLGDAVVLARRKPDAWANLVAARESDVVLVVSGGRARYGSYGLMQSAGESVTTTLRLGRYLRRVILSQPNDPAQLWTWDDVTARLDAVRADAAVHPPIAPAGLGEEARTARSPLAGDPPGTPPIEATPDLLAAAHLTGPPPAGVTLTIEPLDPLYHSLTWLSSITGRGFHGGVLDGLAAFYR